MLGAGSIYIFRCPAFSDIFSLIDADLIPDSIAQKVKGNSFQNIGTFFISSENDRRHQHLRTGCPGKQGRIGENGCGIHFIVIILRFSSPIGPGVVIGNQAFVAVGYIIISAVSGIFAPGIFYDPGAVPFGKKGIFMKSVGTGGDLVTVIGVPEIFSWIVIVPANDHDFMIDIGIILVFKQVNSHKGVAAGGRFY